jgi:hypothetical protein
MAKKGRDSIGVNLTAGDDFAVGGDVVGRDKNTIHNIVIVGQFLRQINLEGLIPEPLAPATFETISAAYRHSFADHVDADLAGATRVAGEMLAKELAAWIPVKQASPIPYRRLLPSLASILVQGLKQRGYWKMFSQEQSQERKDGNITYRVVWLNSMAQLWEKYLKQKCYYGICEETEVVQKKLSYPANVYQRAQRSIKKRQYFVVRSAEHGKFASADFENIDSEEFRVFMAGLVIDIIRFASIAISDARLIKTLVDELSPSQAQKRIRRKNITTRADNSNKRRKRTSS